MAEITQLEVMWNQIEERAKQLFTPISFSAFIEPLVPQDIVNRKIVLKAETDLVASVITTSHAEKLREAVEEKKMRKRAAALTDEKDELKRLLSKYF